jgi:PAS domain-containing protein
MRDRDKGKEQLLNELVDLRKKIVELKNVRISHNTQAKKESPKSEELYSLIAGNTSDVITLTTFNLHPVCTYVSPSIKASTGYEPEELIGKSPFDFIHPDDKKKLFPILKKYISAKVKKLLTGKELCFLSPEILPKVNKSEKLYIKASKNLPVCLRAVLRLWFIQMKKVIF